MSSPSRGRPTWEATVCWTLENWILASVAIPQVSGNGAWLHESCAQTCRFVLCPLASQTQSLPRAPGLANSVGCPTELRRAAQAHEAVEAMEATKAISKLRVFEASSIFLDRKQVWGLGYGVN